MTWALCLCFRPLLPFCQWETEHWGSLGRRSDGALGKGKCQLPILQPEVTAGQQLPYVFLPALVQKAVSARLAGLSLLSNGSGQPAFPPPFPRKKAFQGLWPPLSHLPHISPGHPAGLSVPTDLLSLQPDGQQPALQGGHLSSQPPRPALEGTGPLPLLGEREAGG